MRKHQDHELEDKRKKSEKKKKINYEQKIPRLWIRRQDKKEKRKKKDKI